MPLGLVIGGGLVGSRGLELSILDDNCDLSSEFTLTLDDRSGSSMVGRALSVLEVGSSDEATVSVATV